MRKLFVAALLGSTFLFPTASYAESSYLKLGLGESTYSGDPNKSSTAGLLAYGWKIYPNMFAEIGYIDFGSASTKFSPDLGINLVDRIKTQSIYAAGISSVPLSSFVSVQGKLGLVMHHTNTYAKIQFPDQSFSDDATHRKTRLLVGAGLSAQFTKEISGLVDYTYFGAAVDGRVISLISANLQYHF